MKKGRIYLIFTLLLLCSTVWAQESMFTLSGGYAFSKFEDADKNGTGWRINGSYEYNPNEGNWAHGFVVGYISLKTSTSDIQTVDYKFSSWPVYFAPKYMFGNSSLRGFAKGALGMHFASYKRTGSVTDIKLTNGGFYGGFGLGLTKTIKETTFINLEYEWAYMSNTSDYSTGFMNSIMLGIGMRF